MPGTSKVYSCGSCRGKGKVDCRSCKGTALVACTWCRGSGARKIGNRVGLLSIMNDNTAFKTDRCTSCSAKGSRKCTSAGCWRGEQKCDPCSGNGRMRSFKQLKVSFKVQQTDAYTPADVSVDCLKRTSGILKLSENKERISPVTDHTSQELIKISQQMVAAHQAEHGSRLLKQRHYISEIPIVKGNFTLRHKCHWFTVYGQENLCDIKDHPVKCTII